MLFWNSHWFRNYRKSSKNFLNWSSYIFFVLSPSVEKRVFKVIIYCWWLMHLLKILSYAFMTRFSPMPLWQDNCQVLSRKTFWKVRMLRYFQRLNLLSPPLNEVMWRHLFHLFSYAWTVLWISARGHDSTDRGPIFLSAARESELI